MLTNPHLESNVQWQIKPFTQEKDYIYISFTDCIVNRNVTKMNSIIG